VYLKLYLLHYDLGCYLHEVVQDLHYYPYIPYFQTKQEEARRARGDIMPSQYQPDLSVRARGGDSAASGTSSASTSVTPTGTPAQNAVTPMNTPRGPLGALSSASSGQTNTSLAHGGKTLVQRAGKY